MTDSKVLTIDAKTTADLAQHGTYSLKLRAYFRDVPSVQTELFFNVKLVDPCISSTLTVNDDVFKPIPILSMAQFVNYDALQLSWTDSIITHSVVGGSDVCGPLKYTLTDMVTDNFLDATVFTENLAFPTKTLDVQTNDASKAVVYQLQLAVGYENYSDFGMFPDYEPSLKNFEIAIEVYCNPTTVTKTT